jgi:hypothetical protein
LKGYIKDAGEDSFIVVDKAGAASTISYSQVKQIKGSHHLTAAKVALTIVKGVLIVGAVAGAFTLLLALTIPKT